MLSMARTMHRFRFALNRLAVVIAFTVFPVVASAQINASFSVAESNGGTVNWSHNLDRVDLTILITVGSGDRVWHRAEIYDRRWDRPVGRCEVIASGNTSCTLSLTPDTNYAMVLNFISVKVDENDSKDWTTFEGSSTSLYFRRINTPPIVSISGGDRTLEARSNDALDAYVQLSGSATDSNGSVDGTSLKWLVNGEIVKTGTSLFSGYLDVGTNTVTFSATDNEGASGSASVTITVVSPNEAPSVSISGGNQSVSDTDGVAGEMVSISGSASDSDGSVASTSWLVDGEVVATGTSANLSLPDGSTTVTFRATDDDGESTSTSVTVTVEAPVIPNIAPVVSIIGGSRTVSDSDGESGETVTLTASASDSDGSVASTSWLVDGEVVATGRSANLSLPDGSTTVTFRATDDDGDSTSTSVTITVAAPAGSNAVPEVSISGGNRSISDTDGMAGEIVSVTASATDSDGSIASSSWLIGGEVVASGTSARLALSDGSTTVTFRATDDDGDSTSKSVTITVEAPVETEEEFVTEYNGIAAPSYLSEEINTVSVFDMSKLKLRSCIRLTLGGEPYSLNGYEQYDMNFNLLSLDDLTFRLVDFRPFNLNGSRNQFGETPDCSGQFELSSNVYKDIVAIPGTTAAGNMKYDYFDLVLDLIDIDSLLFKLRDFSVISSAE